MKKKKRSDGIENRNNNFTKTSVVDKDRKYKDIGVISLLLFLFSGLVEIGLYKSINFINIVHQFNVSRSIFQQECMLVFALNIA